MLLKDQETWRLLDATCTGEMSFVNDVDDVSTTFGMRC